ncbi:MAG: 4Fe-4S binding protein [Syntrophobacteraceae bacterium]
MHSALQDKTAQLLTAEDILGVLGLREEDGCFAPHVFTTFDETARLVPGPRWPLAKTAWRLARFLPEGTSLGLVCRGCDIRALEELVKAGQLRPGAVRTIGFSCSADQAGACLCETPFPPGHEPAAGVDPMSLPAVLALTTGPDRLDLWRDHFRRCIKCYGCRNACPLCVCPSCKLEEDGYVTLGMVPPDPLAFHLIRAMHLADRCVGCGACQESCPSGLPLLALHLAMRRALRERTGYVSGAAALSPLLTAGREEGSAGAAGPLWEDTLEEREHRGGNHAR